MQKINVLVDPRRVAAAELRQRLRTMINRQYGKHGRHQLFMHAVPHTDGVTRRGNILAKVLDVPCHVRPLVVVACSGHDVIQRWSIATVDGRVIRRRAYGESEDESISLVVPLMLQTGVFSDEDVAVVADAIAHTKVQIHPELQSVYQPLLTPASSLVALIVAFADTGTASMDGWKAFSREGRLLFHEMYPRRSDHTHELRMSFLDTQRRFILARRTRFTFETAGLFGVQLPIFANSYEQHLRECEKKLNHVQKHGEENPIELARWYQRVLPGNDRSAQS